MSPTWAVSEDPDTGEAIWERLSDGDVEELHCSLRTDGWTVEQVDGGYAYVVPGGTPHADGGQFGVDFYWEVDEAMEVAGDA